MCLSLSSFFFFFCVRTRPDIFFAAHSRSSCPPHRLARTPSYHVCGGRRKTANSRPPPPLTRGPSWSTRHKKETTLKKCGWRTEGFSPNTPRATDTGPSGPTTKSATCTLKRVVLCWRRASQPLLMSWTAGCRTARARRLLRVPNKPIRWPFAGMCCFSFPVVLASLFDLIYLANASRYCACVFCSRVANY